MPSQKKSEWSTEMEQRFLSVFKPYPNHTGGNEARAEFAKINPDDALLEQMRLAIEWQAPVFLRRKERRFIPQFRRWLHNRYWEEDELDEYKRPSREGKKPEGCLQCGFNTTLHWLKKNAPESLPGLEVCDEYQG